MSRMHDLTSDYQQGFAAAGWLPADAKILGTAVLRLEASGYHTTADSLRALQPPTVTTPNLNFTAGIEAMRAALVEYYRVWPRDDMVADHISKFDVPKHFLRPPAAPAEREACPICGGDCAGANPPMIYCPMRDNPPHEIDPIAWQIANACVDMVAAIQAQEGKESPVHFQTWLAYEIDRALKAREPAGAPGEVWRTQVRKANDEIIQDWWDDLKGAAPDVCDLARLSVEIAEGIPSPDNERR